MIHINSVLRHKPRNISLGTKFCRHHPFIISFRHKMSSSSDSPTASNTTSNNPSVTSQNTPSNTTDDATVSEPVQSKPLLALPAADSSSTQLNVNGDSIKLDHLGPMVVNTDGTLSRIGNWQEMGEIERKNTLRVLGKRNKARLEALRGEGNQVLT